MSWRVAIVLGVGACAASPASRPRTSDAPDAATSPAPEPDAASPAEDHGPGNDRPAAVDAARSIDTAAAPLEIGSFGAIAQGGNDTAVFQRALDMAAAARKPLHVPASARPYQVGPLRIPSNTALYLDSGAVVQATPGFGASDSLMSLTNAANVSIIGYGATFRMLKSEYTSGESRMCMVVRNSQNVSLKGFACNDSGGDGVYIAGNSRDVYLEDLTLDNNRRNGLSVISATGLWVRRCRMTNTNGNDPEDGIDIEPNLASDALVNLHFEGNVNPGNRGDGFQMSLYAQAAASAPIGITVVDHRDSNAGQCGFRFDGDDRSAFPGTISVQNSSVTDSGDFGVLAAYWRSDNANISFQNVSITNAKNNRKPTYGLASAIVVARGGGSTHTMGNVSFSKMSVADTKGLIDYYFAFEDFSKIGIVSVKFLDPGPLSNAKTGQGRIDGQPTLSVDR